ncbi:MAG: hypothetical protein K6L73_09225 [Cellvibrionaceae bacterium]
MTTYDFNVSAPIEAGTDKKTTWQSLGRARYNQNNEVIHIELDAMPLGNRMILFAQNKQPEPLPFDAYTVQVTLDTAGAETKFLTIGHGNRAKKNAANLNITLNALPFEKQLTLFPVKD